MQKIKVTIEGPMAVGKTRLAHKIAALLISEGHGVHLYEEKQPSSVDSDWALQFKDPRNIQIRVRHGK